MAQSPTLVANDVDLDFWRFDSVFQKCPAKVPDDGFETAHLMAQPIQILAVLFAEVFVAGCFFHMRYLVSLFCMCVPYHFQKSCQSKSAYFLPAFGSRLFLFRHATIEAWYTFASRRRRTISEIICGV
jgi:hypothetical protein